MKVIFMGTPDFAVPSLEALLDAGHTVTLVVTQPDSSKGRGKHLHFSPVKQTALAHDLEVYQPERIRNPECIAHLQQYEADVIVVAAFGQILPKEILEMPPYGSVNIHASLLPKYRGAAPIQWAVINGEKVTGVTTMQMDVGLDTGDILQQREVVLDAKETAGSLFDKLSHVGAELCIETLKGLQEGTVHPVPQDSSQSTHTSMIKKSDGLIDFSKPAREIECLIRGMNPWPSAYTYLDGKMLKIWDADVVNTEGDNIVPGTVAAVEKNYFLVQTGKGQLKMNEVQLSGKKRMDCGSFLRGCHVAVGTVLQDHV